MEQKNKNNKTAPRLSGRTLVLLVGGVLGVALITWLVLVIGIFGGKIKKNSEDAPTPKPTMPAEVPEGMVVVFRATEAYEYDEDGNRKKTYTARYDDFGRLSELVYWSDGKKSGRSVYSYDEAKHQTERFDYTADGEKYAQYVITYNENGDKTQEVQYYADSDEIRYSADFNEKGIIIKYVSRLTTILRTDDGEEYERIEDGEYVVKSVLSDDGRILERTTNLYYGGNKVERFTYDESTGKLLECKIWNDGRLEEKIVYEGVIRITYSNAYETSDPQEPEFHSWVTVSLDEYGNVLSSKAENVDFGGLYEWISYEYDADSAKAGKYYKKIEHDKDGRVTSCIEYEYSKAWQELKETSYSPGDEDYFTKYWEMDEYGNPVRYKIHYPDEEEELVSYEYEYIPMVIPKEYMHEDEEHYVGIRYE